MAREALSRATCAQVEFALAMGVDVLVGAQDNIASLGSITFRPGPLPRIGPRVPEELAGHGLIIRSGTVTAVDVTT
jgi:hypothetical protein